jgi:hypothetical protein
MKNQIMVMGMILSIAIFLSTTITSWFQTSVPPNAFGQYMIDSTYESNSIGASNIRNNNNNSDNNMADDKIVAVSTITATSNSSAAPSRNVSETNTTITVNDVINSTYIASNEDDQDDSERRIVRAIRDRINDLLHTVVSSNATIISRANISNDFVGETTIVNNNTRFLEEVLPTQLGIALDRIRAVGSISQTANSMLELHTDIEIMCVASSTSFGNCDISMRIR